MAEYRKNNIRKDSRGAQSRAPARKRKKKPDPLNWILLFGCLAVAVVALILLLMPNGDDGEKLVVMTGTASPEEMDYSSYFDENGENPEDITEDPEYETVFVPVKELSEEEAAEYAETPLFEDLLGSCETPHTAVYNRTRNLELAAAALDGVIVKPGETFSFNDTVGERTAEKGYREASIYMAGETVPEIGGGVCQVASTLYGACLYADLNIVESHAHQFLTTYTQPGVDTTIYYHALDYRFRNDSGYPLKIRASVSNGYVRVKLWGTQTKNYTVKIVSELRYTADYDTEYHVIREGEDYKDGEVITSPYTGYTYITYMEKYDAGGNRISTSQIRTSHYAKRNKVIAVLTDPNATEAETEQTETEPGTTVPAVTETEPQTTAAPVTEPPAPVTEPPAPVTEPPAPETEPPAPETEPPATEPPATEPPATEPPAAEPPATGE